MQQNLGILGRFVEFQEHALIKDTIAGTTKPNRVTYLMWSTSPLIAFFAALTRGFNFSLVPIFVSGFSPLLILAASFVNKHSYWRLGKLDYACLALSTSALVAWGLTGDVNIAIFFAILSDGAATLPTLTKSYTNPETETLSNYVVALVGSLTIFFGIKTFSFTSLAFPIYLTIANSLLVLFVARKHYR